MAEFGNAFSGMASDRKLSEPELVRAIRMMIAAEYEAVQLYMQLAESAGNKLAKEVLVEALRTKRDPADIVAAKGLAQISDAGALETVVAAVIQRNEKSVNDYKGGKKNALAHLMGQVMKETKGAANPAMVSEILKKKLGE